MAENTQPAAATVSSDDALLALLTGTAPAPKPQAEAPAAPAAAPAAAETKTVEAPKEATEEPAKPTAAAAEDEDPAAKLLDQFLASKAAPAAPAQLTGEAAELSVLKEQHALAQEQLKQFSTYKDAFDRLPEPMQRAVMLEYEGKSGVEFLRTLPNADILKVTAEKIPAKTLLETYRPEVAKGITAEEWQEFEEGVADDALKAKVKHFTDIAADVHEAKRTALVEQIKGEQKAHIERAERYTKAIAENVSYLKQNEPVLAGLLDSGTVEKFRSGALIGEMLFQEDGATPKPEALTTLMKARMFDGLVQRMVNGAAKGAREEALLEANSRKPQAPKVPGRHAANPEDKPNTDVHNDLINYAIGARR